MAKFVLVISISFICFVEENCVILLDIEIGLPYTHLQRRYEIDPEKANEPCYLCVLAIVVM